MIFGIWPGVVDADLVDFSPMICPPEEVDATCRALRRLQGRAPLFYVRSFRHFGAGAQGFSNAVVPTPADPAVYLGDGRQVDLVCCYQSMEPDPVGYAKFVRTAIRDIHEWGGGKIQIGEELNMPAPLDGGSPGCFHAIAAGVRAASEERERLGADVLIGVNAAGMANEKFWETLACHLKNDMDNLDYLGLDIFPDVFFPIPQETLTEATRFVLDTARQHSSTAGFPISLPFHITETGWPTGRDRTEGKQAEVLVRVAEAILTSGHNVTAYEFFGLRDAATSGDWKQEFGIMRDDYSPKPAFGRVLELIANAS